MGTETNSQGIKTLQNQLMKYHVEYDGDHRMVTEYSAPTDTRHGEPCIRTRYTYEGASERVVNMREDNSTWDQAWDVFP